MRSENPEQSPRDAAGRPRLVGPSPWLTELLARGVAGRVFPAAAAWVAVDWQPAAVAWAGACDRASLWDLASVTKPRVVGTLAMQGVAEGWLDLDARVPPIGASVRDLLAHRSGLPAWDELWRHLDAERPGWARGADATRSLVEQRIVELYRARHPAGAPAAPPAAEYSDLGYLLLGWHLERLRGAPLSELVPLYLPGAPAERIVPTGTCERRGAIAPGDVNDLNCWCLGGVAGHAGAFDTIEGVAAWALDLGRSAAGLEGASLPAHVVRGFWSLEHYDDDDTWVVGWDTPTPGRSQAGRTVASDAAGHLGFTGTSVWIEPSRGLVTVLLTNRVAHGMWLREAMRAFRPDFHDRVRGRLGIGGGDG